MLLRYGPAVSWLESPATTTLAGGLIGLLGGWMAVHVQARAARNQTRETELLALVAHLLVECDLLWRAAGGVHMRAEMYPIMDELALANWKEDTEQRRKSCLAATHDLLILSVTNPELEQSGRVLLDKCMNPHHVLHESDTWQAEVESARADFVRAVRLVLT